jgi:hypothetical protein
MLPTKFRFIWPNGFRGEELKISTNQKQKSPMAVMCVNGSGRNELTLQRIFHRCFLPSISSFGWGVSEEKIKMGKVNRRRTTDAKWWQKLTLPLARWAKNHITGHMRVILCLFVLWCLTPLSTIFSYIVVVSFNLLVKETRVPGENHRPVASHWQTLSHNVLHLVLIEIRTHNISGDRHTFTVTSELMSWICHDMMNN